MASQSYYKDVLGFDPNETQIKSSMKITKHQSESRSLHRDQNHKSSSGSVGSHNNTQYATYHRLEKHQMGTSPARISISPGGASLDHYADTSPAKKAKHSFTQQQPQGGYEDALTQFKGTMSIWEYFIENWDIMRKSFCF